MLLLMSTPSYGDSRSKRWLTCGLVAAQGGCLRFPDGASPRRREEASVQISYGRQQSGLSSGLRGNDTPTPAARTA